MQKKLIWLGLFVGSTAGGFIPELWGGSGFSFSALLFSMLGGIAGIWLGYKVGKSI